METTFDTMTLDALRAKYEALAPVMDERVCRLWAAVEAQSLGRGGAAAVKRATGISGRRLWEGKKELAELGKQAPVARPRQQRVRRPGGGRKRLVEKDPTLLKELELLLEPATRGDPESALRWTTKSVRKLAAELQAKGHPVSPDSVARRLHESGYSLQAPRKEEEGADHPERDEQFRYISRQTREFQAREQPVVSVEEGAGGPLQEWRTGVAPQR
jgi:transposase